MIHQIVAEYVWLGGAGELRSKARTLYIQGPHLKSLDSYPSWNYDGSSTGQAKGNYSEVIIRPRAIFNCPFRRGTNVLVMCDTHRPDGTPLENNNRMKAETIFNEKLDEEPWFGLEQEYFMMDPNGEKPDKDAMVPDEPSNNPSHLFTSLRRMFPLGSNIYSASAALRGVAERAANPGLTNSPGDPAPATAAHYMALAAAQGAFYCSTGHGKAFGRKLADEHYKACLHAGIKISGINAEVAAGQWEYQVGPCLGIEAGDHLWMARYILERLSEEHDVCICLDPKPVKGDWNGSGCHTNYSTKNMREGTEDRTGLEFIEEAVDKLSLKHKEHMDVYGTGNEKRMTGAHETAKFDEFSSGVANRGASVRIGNETAKDKKGYFEDRRPSSNVDPYLVTSILFKTTILD
jgi:glutamine synthetase